MLWEKKMSWTDDRVALLTKLWGEGKTAAEIAKELGGVTRNAVIGKAHRLKLSNRVSPIQQNKKIATPKAQNQNTPKVQVQAPKRIKEVIDDNRKRVSLAELGASECRWPLGDPKGDNFGFCGCVALPSLPYCLEHAQLAYQPATRNKIMKDHAAKETVTAEELEAAKKAVAAAK